MFILNPPYTLAQSMNEALPYLVERLGQDSGARFQVEQRGN
jgi:23S rRNA (adenine2030-N6)-methyltransferase